MATTQTSGGILACLFDERAEANRVARLHIKQTGGRWALIVASGDRFALLVDHWPVLNDPTPQTGLDFDHWDGILDIIADFDPLEDIFELVGVPADERKSLIP